ncbi:hypothetical protein H6G33_11985 [Calothrix sp. FACHB-1219]|nr:MULTISPECIES: hypothetical protein [unclassified Calothrix]MBD2202345.1 hypothetical protein [Calothrix sp. FACHB-168]MBD2217751.1 hypothetical protein [Calothrix sp. FACHB-1219]
MHIKNRRGGVSPPLPQVERIRLSTVNSQQSTVNSQQSTVNTNISQN